MVLVGVADVVTDSRVRVAVERGYPVFAADVAGRDQMKAIGIPVAGTHDDLLDRVDIVADCAPKRVAAANKDRCSPSPATRSAPKSTPRG